ncbi:MAG: hypothetical protein QGI60_05250 [archaeon]|nr:hypothetical protein [archaeon]
MAEKMGLRFKISIFLVVVLGFALVGMTQFYQSQADLERALQNDYPEFLQGEFSSSLLDYKIIEMSASEVGESSLERLWKLLWIKKEFYKNNYLPEELRQGFVQRISEIETNSLNTRYYQFNLLKYKLGVANADDLMLFEVDAEAAKENICSNLTILDEVDWSDAMEVSKAIELKFFCGVTPNVEEFEKAKLAVGLRVRSEVQHCAEHCFEDVPVYVNDCSRAENENEQYHCLFFLP